MATSQGFLGNIANIFRPVQPVQQQAQQPMPQVNPGAAVLPSPGESNPTVPSNPLDEFTPLWQTDPNAKPVVDPLSAPLFQSNPQAIAEAASKIDFVGQIPAELIQKAMSGQDPQAFAAVMNAVAQRTLATATQLSTATIEQANTRNNARMQQVLPDRMKKIQLDSLTSENPALQHPASQPLLQMVRSQIQMKNPQLSATEINQRAESYLSGFASQLTAPQQAAEAAKQGSNEVDWEAWARL